MKHDLLELLAAHRRGEEFEEIVLHLVPDDDGREVLRELYRAYAEALEEELRPHHREHMTLLGFVPDETPEERRERRAKLPGLREKVRSIIEQADDRLFLEIRDALALVDDDPRWHRLRALRRRTARQIPTISGHGHDQNRAAEVDLVSVLIAVPLTPEEWEAIDAEVGDYEKRMLELLNARLAVIPVQEGTPAVFRAEDWEEIRRRGEAPHVAHREVTRFNQETVERLLEALPWETAWHVRDAFNRLAYPLAYDDPASMERVIAQAASLPDLGPAQRDQITEIRAEFTSAYEQVRSAILALCVEFEPDLVIAHLSRTLSPEKIEMKEHFTQHFAKLSDERAAVNRRALRGLRSALTPAQLRRLDLPHVE